MIALRDADDSKIVESQIPWHKPPKQMPKGIPPTMPSPTGIRLGKVLGVTFSRGPVIFYRVQVGQRVYEDVMAAPNWYPGDEQSVWFQVWHQQELGKSTVELYSCSPIQAPPERRKKKTN